MTNAPTTRETADHAELARLAEAASEGPWSLKEGSTPYPESDDADSWAAILTPRGHAVLTLYERYGVKGEDRSDYDDDARFIAAANPATVLSLLSEIAALRGERDGLRNRVSCLERLGGEQSTRVMEQATRAKDAERQRDELRKALEFCAQPIWSIRGEFPEPSPHSEYRPDCGDTARQALANQGADQ